MSYEVSFTTAAARQHKKLVGEQTVWCIRVGDDRVIYDIPDAGAAVGRSGSG